MLGLGLGLGFGFGFGFEFGFGLESVWVGVHTSVGGVKRRCEELLVHLLRPQLPPRHAACDGACGARDLLTPAVAHLLRARASVRGRVRVRVRGRGRVRPP